MAAEWQIERAIFKRTPGPATEKNVRIDNLPRKWKGWELAGRKATIQAMFAEDAVAMGEILEILHLDREFAPDETYDLVSVKPHNAKYGT
jgi:hypothetical protein